MLFAPGKDSVPRGPMLWPKLFLSELYQNCSSFRQYFVANGAWQIGACKNVQVFQGPMYRDPICPGLIFPGLNLPKKNHPWAKFAWTHFLSGVDLNLDIGFSHDVFPTLSAFFSWISLSLSLSSSHCLLFWQITKCSPSRSICQWDIQYVCFILAKHSPNSCLSL